MSMRRTKGNTIRIIPIIECNTIETGTFVEWKIKKTFSITADVTIGNVVYVSSKCPNCSKNLTATIKTAKRDPKKQFYLSPLKGLQIALVGSIVLAIFFDLVMGTNIKTLGVLNALQVEFQDRLDYLAKEAIFFFIALIIIVVFGSDKLNKVNNKPYSYNVSLESSFRSHHHLVDVKELEFH